MAPHKTITVNGRIYDAVTGLPVAAEGDSKSRSVKPAQKKQVVSDPVKLVGPTAPTKPKVVRPVADIKPMTPRSRTAAGSVHTSLQRSQTLNRRAIKKPVTPNRPKVARPTVGKQMDIAKSGSISRFAKNPVVVEKPVIKPADLKTAKTSGDAIAKADKPAQSHPVAQRAMLRVKPKSKVVKKPVTAKEIKDAEIAKAMASLQPKTSKRAKKARKPGKTLRRLIIIGISLAITFGALFAIYRLLPSVSVSIAATRAGVSASYPEFVPDGYSLSQPVTYSDGEVDLKFKSNSNDNYYRITQTRSSWDSTAVLDNIVTPAAGADYVTTRERGLTIYTYDSIAVWVNGGILYKIDSKAPLSGDQIRRIATSL